MQVAEVNHKLMVEKQQQQQQKRRKKGYKINDIYLSIQMCVVDEMRR